MSWLQQIGINPATLPFFNPQVLPTQLIASPVATVDTMPMMKSTNLPESTAAGNATPVGTQGGGLVTVITMTPTANLPTVVQVSQSPTPISPTRVLETPYFGTTTPIPTVPLPPTLTLTPGTIVPILAQDLSAMMTEIKADIHNLNQVLQASLTMMETFRQRQPTEIEITAMKAQLGVVDQRMGKLMEIFNAILTRPDLLVKDSKIYFEYSQQVLGLMRQSTEMMQAILSNSAVDLATIDRIQRLIGEFQKILGLMPGLLSSIPNNNQPTSLPATPTMTANPTVTTAPTASPTAISVLNAELKKLQFMLEQMKEMLSQIQGMLMQMQN